MRSRLSSNMAANVASFAISILVSMWLTPFILHTLGSEAYGFIPLTQQIINYMTVITAALNGMVARFFTFAIKSGDEELAQRYFNTSLISSAILSVGISLLIILITVFIGNIVQVPEYMLFDVRVSLILCGVMFIISTVGTSFSMAMFCENRTDISGMLGSMNTIVRSLLIVLLLTLFIPKMWAVSLGSLLAAIIAFVQSIYYCNKLLPNIKINIRKFDFSRLKDLFASGVWSSINFIGAVLFLQIDLLVANWALGPRLAGEYSAVLQLSNLLRGFVASIVVVFGPTMVELYAKGKSTELIDYSNQSIKITGVIMALPIGLACGLGGILLELWLGKGFAGYGLLFFIMTIHLSVNLAVQPLFGIFSAANRVKLPAIVTLIMGAVNFALAIILSMTFKLGALGIVIAGLIVLTAKNLVFTPLYCSIITQQPLRAYYKGILMPVTGVVCVVVLSFAGNSLINIRNWPELIIASLSISIIYAVMIYFFVLNNDERQKMKGLVNRNLNAFTLGGR